MNIFQKISLISKVNKAVKEFKKLQAENSPVVDEIVAIINDLIEILDRLKKVIPQVADCIEAIIEIIKKWFKK